MIHSDRLFSFIIIIYSHHYKIGQSMIICLAQARSIKGDIPSNIKNHLSFIERAHRQDARLILFPELSISAYEPAIAQEVAMQTDDPRLDIFQSKADQYNMYIGIGIPTKHSSGIRISLILFQPDKPRYIYSKQMLHEDELPYFQAGQQAGHIQIDSLKLGFAICYESLQLEHFIKAKNDQCDLYVASVAKPQRGISKAIKHYNTVSKSYQTPILMANAIGYYDNFLSVGQTGAWNTDGALLASLNETDEGILLYDSSSQTASIESYQIVQAKLSDVDSIVDMYRQATARLREIGLNQWTDHYPNKNIIQKDIEQEQLFILKNNANILGAVTLNEEQEEKYKTIDWKYRDGKVLVIHRLVIHPDHQGLGFARILMDYSENVARKQQYSSIRLDAYSSNKQIIQFYSNRNFEHRGEIFFPERTEPFYAMEKAYK